MARRQNSQVGSQRYVVSESLVTAAGGETGELGCDSMVVVVKEAKRQVLQLGEQRQLVLSVAYTGVVADAVVGHRFCSAIFDGSYRLVFAEFLTDLLFELVCDFTGKSVWPGEREMIAERGGSNLL